MQTLEQLRAGKLNGARSLKLRCGLTTFPREILALKESLEILDLTGNQLSSLPDELAELQQLRVIFCSENRFTELPEVLGRCPKLTMVGFKANQITTVSPQALPAKLRWLILTDNQLTALPTELGSCLELQKLMLAGNHLTELPETLAQCQKLELIRIAANRLQRFPDWLLSLPHLSWLAYSGNPFCQSLEAEATKSKINEVPWRDLHLAESLGQGASGIIHRAHYLQNQAQQAVAVKLFKGAVTSDGLPQCEMAAAIASGKHPNLINVLGKISDHPSGTPALVMELIDPKFRPLAEPPSLASCTRDIYPTKLAFSRTIVVKMASSIASVARHLHAAGLMHGDLYGHNILHNGAGDLLLGDFGAASFYDRSDSNRAQAFERLEVRAFGCLLEELLEHCTAEPESLVPLHALKAACLAEIPEQRPGFAEINKQLEVLNNQVAEGLFLDSHNKRHTE